MEYLFGFIFFLLQGMQIFLVLGTLLPLILPADNMLRIGIARIVVPCFTSFSEGH